MTRFVPGGNGRLILQIDVQSAQLPAPIHYTMACLRAGESPAATAALFRPTAPRAANLGARLVGSTKPANA